MLEGEGGNADMPPESKNWFTAATLLAHPFSRGSTDITSASSSSPGLAMDPKGLSHPFDVEVLARHVQQLETILKTERLASRLVRNGRHLPSTNNLSKNEARKLVRQKAVAAHYYSVMGEFGMGVSALLETYGKCLSLLKAFKGHPRSGDDSATSEAHSQLRKTLRSDRSRVRAAYKARLYRDGKRLSQGDSQSRSKLKRIVDKLQGAILTISNMAKTRKASIDYASLVSLSNSSRVDAIKTMDELSHRLSGSSSSSVGGKKKTSSSSTSSPPSSSNPKSARKHRSRESTVKKSKQDGKDSGNSKLRKPSKDNKVAREPDSVLSHGWSWKQKNPKETTKQAKENPPKDSRNPTGTPELGRTTDPRSRNRNSFWSMSTDSTKLGEIPPGRSRLTRNPESDGKEYVYRPAYPLHAPKPATGEKSGLFKRFFGAKD
ncbi:hypothetical protein DL768_005561 [Monosporascus sp. mg162]|nr:hypothetical protein DL768_005561 [Monosporascus sp. mg162]